MRRGLIAVGLAILLAGAGGAEACSRAIPDGAATKVVPSRGIDQGLLDRAVRAEVNFHRCRAGLRPLGRAPGRLSIVARHHSEWMAETQILSHRSTVAGRASLAQRVRASGVPHEAGAENLGMVSRYRIDNRRFRIVDRQSCVFADAAGNRIGAHSYATLAREVVQLWMESPGHRRNILHRDLDKVSTAVAFDPRSGYCGRFWITQNFVG